MPYFLRGLECMYAKFTLIKVLYNSRLYLGISGADYD